MLDLSQKFTLMPSGAGCGLAKLSLEILRRRRPWNKTTTVRAKKSL